MREEPAISQRVISLVLCAIWLICRFNGHEADPNPAATV